MQWIILSYKNDMRSRKKEAIVSYSLNRNFAVFLKGCIRIIWGASKKTDKPTDS